MVILQRREQLLLFHREQRCWSSLTYYRLVAIGCMSGCGLCGGCEGCGVASDHKLSTDGHEHQLLYLLILGGGGQGRGHVGMCLYMVTLVRSSGVFPSLFVALYCAPYSMRSWTMGAWFQRAALCSALSPRTLDMVTSAPRWKGGESAHT